MNELTIGEKIKTLRKQNGLTQKQLAEAIPISFSTFRRWEKGEHSPNIPQLSRLAEILNTDLTCLLDKKEQSQNVYEQVLNLGKKISDENAELENPISVGIQNNMLIFKEGDRSYFVPNDKDGRNLFLEMWKATLQGMGLNPILNNEINGDNNTNNQLGYINSNPKNQEELKQ